MTVFFPSFFRFLTTNRQHGWVVGSAVCATRNKRKRNLRMKGHDTFTLNTNNKNLSSFFSSSSFLSRQDKVSSKKRKVLFLWMNEPETTTKRHNFSHISERKKSKFEEREKNICKRFLKQLKFEVLKSVFCLCCHSS